MTAGFVLLCVAALAVAAATVSLLVGAALWVARRQLGRLAPEAQARVWLAAALAPAFASVAMLGGWMADIHLFACDAHRCVHDHAANLPPPAGLLIAVALLGRGAMAIGRVVNGLWRARRMRRLLAAVASADAQVNVVPGDEPQAFVLGVLHPQVYASRGLLAATDGGDLEPILAHERAHVRRRDPLRRLAATLGLAFHVPWIAAWLERGLARAHETAADAEAARALGDAPRVAEALVRFVRRRLVRPAGVAALAWAGGDLEARVRDLLAEEPRSRQPAAGVLAGLALAVLALAVLTADPVHSAAEALLRLLDG